MSFFEILNNLRSKPEDVKKRIAWLATIAVGLIIFSLWVLSLNSRLAKIQPPPQKSLAELSENSVKNQGLPSLSSSLKDMLNALTKKENSGEEKTAENRFDDAENSIKNAKPAKLPIEK